MGAKRDQPTPSGNEGHGGGPQGGVQASTSGALQRIKRPSSGPRCLRRALAKSRSGKFLNLMNSDVILFLSTVRHISKRAWMCVRKPAVSRALPWTCVFLAGANAERDARRGLCVSQIFSPPPGSLSSALAYTGCASRDNLASVRKCLARDNKSLTGG